MKIYSDMEPQPEIEIFKCVECHNSWEVFVKTSEHITSPYNPGDVIELWETTYNGVKYTAYGLADSVVFNNFVNLEIVKTKGEVKSCTPIQRDGRWQWEVELE